jgi:hypothetical protein
MTMPKNTTQKKSRSSRSGSKKTRRLRSIIRIPISPSGDLGMFGYKGIMKLTEKERHTALMKAVMSKGKSIEKQAIKTRKVIQKLNALAIVQKNKNPEFSEKVRSDQEFLSKYLVSLNEKLQ